MNAILTGPAITAGMDVLALGLEFATVEAGTYSIGENAGYALPPQEVTVEESYEIQTTQFTNDHLGKAREQLGSRNAVWMGSLNGTMKLLARGTEEDLLNMTPEDMEEAVKSSVTMADLRGLEGGFATFDMEAFLADAIDRGPVVIKERYDLIEDEDRRAKFIGPQKPAVLISWDEAKALALLLGEDLLSEEEWEVAARGKEGRIYATPIGQLLDASGKKQGNFGEGWKTGSTTDVGSYPSIQIGGVDVFDLMGNVWEWTDSRFNADDVEDSRRVLRGGSFLSGGDFVRASCRCNYDPVARYYFIGFRLRRASPGLPA